MGDTDNDVESDVIKMCNFCEKNSDKFNVDDEKPADFETAITASGFGKFNIFLYIIATAAGWSSVFETTTMSYVFPAAECDLELKLSHKGLLNAVTYTGMISSAVLWGYLCDTLGRRKLLLMGFLLDALFFLMAATSQSFTMLMVAKFFGGFIINGPYAALTTYLSEFHNSFHRARVQMALGTIFSFGNLILPLLALGILPTEVNVKLGNYFVFHSWNLYLLVCSLPALISGIAFVFLPESPKFLMSMGRNEKALQVFRKVYRLNTGKPEHTYPVKELVDETKMSKENPNKRGGQVTANRTKMQALREGFQQVKPLFFPPHVTKILLVFAIQCFIMMSLNALRLWLPQIFQAVNDYQYYNNETASLCVMLEVFQPKNKSINATECVVNYNNSQVYANSMIVAFTSMIGYIAAGTLINTLGKKKLLYFIVFLVLLGPAHSEMFVFFLFAFSNFIDCSDLAGADVNRSDFCLICFLFVVGAAIVGMSMICNGVRYAAGAVSSIDSCNMIGSGEGILGTVSGSMAMSLYFSRNTPTTVVLAALFVAFGGIGINVILAVVVDLFPTTLRTMTVSLTMMFGRIGAALGNLVFPYLLETGCAPPFFSVGSVMLGCALLTCLLPNTDLKALQ